MLRARRYSRTSGRGCQRIVARGRTRSVLKERGPGLWPRAPLSGCRKSGLRHFFEVFIAPLRLRRGQGAMQGNPCYARLFADLTHMSPNPIKASGGCGSRTPGGFSTSWGRPAGPPWPPNAAAPRMSAPSFLCPHPTAVWLAEARWRRGGGRRWVTPGGGGVLRAQGARKTKAWAGAKGPRPCFVRAVRARRPPGNAGIFHRPNDPSANLSHLNFLQTKRARRSR